MAADRRERSEEKKNINKTNSHFYFSPLHRSRKKVTAGVCMACFIAGLPMVCNGGVYLFTLLDWHTASWAVLLLGMAEVSVEFDLICFRLAPDIYCGSFRSRDDKLLEPIDGISQIKIRVT